MKKTLSDRLRKEANYLSYLGAIDFSRLVLDIRKAADKIDSLELELFQANAVAYSSQSNEEDTLSSRIQQLQEEIKTLKQQILDDNKAYGCELRDPYGTIWQYAEGVRKENEALKAAQAETDCTNWWPTVERFLQATGVKPAYWDETVPEQIERAIAEVAKKFSVSTVVHPCANGILPSPNAVYR
jgi:DNA repair exonuclease SbcCD ATPase subunit